MINSSILHLSHGFSEHSYNDVFIYSTRDQGWERGEKLRHCTLPTSGATHHITTGTHLVMHSRWTVGGVVQAIDESI